MTGFGRPLVSYPHLSYRRALSHISFGPARAVPGRRVASIHAHAQRLYEPYRDKGNWTAGEDSRLIACMIHRFATLSLMVVQSRLLGPALGLGQDWQRDAAPRLRLPQPISAALGTPRHATPRYVLYAT